MMRLIRLLRQSTTAVLFSMAPCFVNADDSGISKIPVTWRVLYDINSDVAKKNYAWPDDGRRYRTAIAEVDVFQDHLAFEVDLWPAYEPDAQPHVVHPSRNLLVFNLATNDCWTTDLDRHQRLPAPHFLGQNGFVLVGTSVLDQTKKKTPIGLPLDKADVTRISPAEFLVHEKGAFHIVDCSALPKGAISVLPIAVPASPKVNLLAVRGDCAAGWSAMSSPYDVVLFSRYSGEISWKDKTRGYLLGVGEKHVYMWSYRIDNGQAKMVLVRKALKQPYSAESVDVPLLDYGAGVIDFNWPNVLLLVCEDKSRVLRLVKANLKSETTTSFDFSVPLKGMSVSSGNANDARPRLYDDMTGIFYMLRGDATCDRVVVASNSILYSVPVAKQSTYEWTDWKWKPYSFDDSKGG